MTITEFAESRNVEPQAVSRFLIRHPEQKQSCSKVGKNIELSESAYELLDKQYPLPKPIQVINGIPEEEHRKKLDELDSVRKDLVTAKDLIITLKDQLTDYQLKLKDAENEQLRIEEKEKIQNTIIAKQENNIKELEKSAEEHRKQSAEQELKLSDLQTENERLKAELEAEKNKSWWDKLLKR